MLWNFTVDAPSPYISYAGSGWDPISSTLDTQWDLYSNYTGICTPVIGDFAKFSFNGSGIWVYGAKRLNHGQYSMQVDNGPSTTYNGEASDDFQTLLYSQTNLTPGAHDLTLKNLGVSSTQEGYVDVDYITYQKILPKDSTSILLDNSDPSFAYLPAPASSFWESIEDTSNFGNSLWRTQSASAVFQVTFTGSAIGIYGRMGTQNGVYSCAIDKQPVMTYTGNYKQTANQQLLCFAGGLDGGEHTMTVSNQPGNQDTRLEIDFAQLYGVNPAGIPAGGSKSKTSIVAIVGGVVGGLVLLGILGTFFFFWWRKRSKYRGRHVPTASEGEDLFPSKPFPADAFGIYSSDDANHENTAHEIDATRFSTSTSHDPQNPFRNPSFRDASSSNPSNPRPSFQSPTSHSFGSPDIAMHIPLSDYNTPSSTIIPDAHLLSPTSPPQNHFHRPSASTSSSFSNGTIPQQNPHFPPIDEPRQNYDRQYQDPYLSESDVSPAELTRPARREEDAGLLLADESATLPPDYDDVRGRR